MSISKKTRIAWAIVIATFAASQGFAATLHVDPNDPNAFQTIQKAIDAAKDLDTVVVHPGVYTEAIDFEGKPITVTSTDPNDPAVVANTVIDANARLRYPSVYVVTFESGETERSVLCGLTIRGGYHGIHCEQDDVKPQIRQCTISANRSAGISGGAPSIIECMIKGNDVLGIGDCRSLVRDCTITRNGKQGISCSNKDIGLSVRNCEIFYNGADGVSLDNCYGTTFINSIISGNQGSAIIAKDSILSVENCTLVENKGGGIVNYWYRGSHTILNSIIAYNAWAAMDNAWSEYNCLYANANGGHSSPKFAKHEITEPPDFVDKGYWDANDVWHQGDYHLASTAGRWDPVAKAWVQDLIDSPCIDKGDPNTPVGDEPSPNGGRINLGAYGGTAEASKSAEISKPPDGPKCTEFPAMDFNHDCKVDQADLDLFMQHWLECGLEDPNACWSQGPPAPPQVQP